MRTLHLDVTQGTSEYGTPEPSIGVRVYHGTFREISAALHKVAAEVELATPSGEQWIVQTGPGRVYLELATGAAEEVEHGMTVLKAVVDKLNGR